MQEQLENSKIEQRTLKIGDRVVYCYSDGSVEFLSNSPRHQSKPLVRTTGSVNSRGYKQISIYVNDKQTKLKIHRLIALAFCPNPEGLPEVDHINRYKTDNRPENLRWADHKTNADNRDYVDQAIAKYGIRCCDDKNAYNKAYHKSHDKHCLNICKPDGTKAMTGALPDEVYNMLKPLSQRERYLKYQELKKKH